MQIPVYSFVHHRELHLPVHAPAERFYAERMPEKKYLYGSKCDHCVRGSLLLHYSLLKPLSEGIMALQSPEMRALYDLKVFVVGGPIS